MQQVSAAASDRDARPSHVTVVRRLEMANLARPGIQLTKTKLTKTTTTTTIAQNKNKNKQKQNKTSSPSAAAHGYRPSNYLRGISR